MQYSRGKQLLTARGIRFRDGSLAYEVQLNGDVGYISAEQYQDRPASAYAALARKGLMVVGPNRKALTDYISEIAEFEDVSLFPRVGHMDGFFAFPDGTAICPDGGSPPGAVFELHPEKVHEAGTQKRWLREVAGPLARHPICEFGMMIPFAGALRAFTNRVENFGWEFVGPPATGKSTLLNLMASVAGGALGGNDGNFGMSFSATAAAIEGEMRNYADLCMIMDEANTFGLGLSPKARGNAFSLLFMSLGRGQEKARFNSRANTYRFVFATSANEPLAHVIAGSSDPAVLAAVADRLMTISLEGRRYGVLERVPDGFTDAGDFLSRLVDGAARSHGTAMRHYLRFVVSERARHPAEFDRRVNERVSEFCEAANMERNNGSARRIAEGFGLVFAAGRIARHCGALPDTYDPLASTLECYRVHAETLSTEPQVLRRIRELAKDAQVVNLDRQGLSKMSDARLAAAKGFIKRNRDRERELLVPPASMRNQFDRWNQIRRDVAISRLLVRDGDGHHTAKRQVRTNKPGDRMVCINLSRLRKPRGHRA